MISDSQYLRVSDVFSDLNLCLLPDLRFSAAFMTVEDDILSAVIIPADFIRKNELLAILCSDSLSVAETIIRISKIRSNSISISVELLNHSFRLNSLVFASILLLFRTSP